MDKYLSEALWGGLGNAVADRNLDSAKLILTQLEAAMKAVPPQEQVTDIPSGKRTAFLREILEENKAFERFCRSEGFKPLRFKTKQYSDWIATQPFVAQIEKDFPEWRSYISNVMADYCNEENPIYKGVERLEIRGHYRLICDDITEPPFFHQGDQ